MEQQLAAGLGERQIAQFIQHDEVEPGEMVGDAALPPAPRLGIETVDQIDDGVEPDPGAATDAGPGDCDGEVALAGSG
ncbi:hypothetical protein GCM10011317_49880 [Niveispirillum cyanobacteriorum]|nr:hypothetical protein GCM10011317_49880 [Niveispirillum cyanobacteriorum]